MRHLFILGPSAVGKSKLASFIASRNNFLHIEIDRFLEGDGIDIENLREEWDILYSACHASSLSTALARKAEEFHRNACVLSFPSRVVLSLSHIAAANGEDISVSILNGSKPDCMRSFQERETSTGRNLSMDHWLTNNDRSYSELSRPEFDNIRIPAFDGRGSRRPLEELALEMVGGA